MRGIQKSISKKDLPEFGIKIWHRLQDAICGTIMTVRRIEEFLWFGFLNQNHHCLQIIIQRTAKRIAILSRKSGRQGSREVGKFECLMPLKKRQRSSMLDAFIESLLTNLDRPSQKIEVFL
jgi:hypothetical protein